LYSTHTVVKNNEANTYCSSTISAMGGDVRRSREL
jgi:hypothetical protein